MGRPSKTMGILFEELKERSEAGGLKECGCRMRHFEGLSRRPEEGELDERREKADMTEEGVPINVKSSMIATPKS